MNKNENPDAWRDSVPFEDETSAPAKPTKAKFVLEPFEAIGFDLHEEWLVKRIIPRQGVGVFYGASQSLKSFTVYDLSMGVATGRDWAGSPTTQAAAVYVAAEGAAGLRKRKMGFELANAGRLPERVPFYLISAAPNLGAGEGDLEPLIGAIEAAGVTPGIIVVDTLAQSLGAGDENGAGMIQFLINATALANRFGCFVLIVHHVGLSDDQRMRGHSSLIGGIDMQMLCERKDKALFTKLTLQKLKDEESNRKFTAHLSRIVIGQDSDGDDVSTLIVESIEEGATDESRTSAKSVPSSQRLLMGMVKQALDEAGVLISFGENGSQFKAVEESAIRTRYYARVAEQAEPGESKKTVQDRQCRSFGRSVDRALKSTLLMAGERDGKRIIWLA